MFVDHSQLPVGIGRLSARARQYKQSKAIIEAALVAASGARSAGREAGPFSILCLHICGCDTLLLEAIESGIRGGLRG
jgi:hypothetical protein